MQQDLASAFQNTPAMRNLQDECNRVADEEHERRQRSEKREQESLAIEREMLELANKSGLLNRY
jgi:hypothetical protein